jgi:uncharacterized protein YhaN
MKIERLTLERYGAFEDTTLDLEGPDVLLHIVHGPNEAGKSTALSAIADLLFGIPERTPYAFRHEYARLRIGAAISDRAGHRLDIRRRKGRQNTLLDANDAPLPDASLAPFLGGADRAFFERLFGLDHQRLRQGGEAMLAAGGDLGRSLFQAGSGITGVLEALVRLRGEAEALAPLRKSASRPFWLAMERHEQAQAHIRQDILRPDQWQQAGRHLRDAETECRAIDEGLAACRERRSRLQRQRRALPIIARVDDLTARLAASGDVPDLPDDFEERWRASDAMAREAADETRRAARRLEELRQALSDTGEPGPLPAHAAEIERLHLATGDVDSKRADLPKLERDLAAGRQELEMRIAQLGARLSPDDVATHLPPRTAVARIRDAITRRAAIDAAHLATGQQREAARERLAEATDALAGLGDPADPAEAAAALAEANAFGDADSRLVQARHAEAAAKEAAGQAMARLGLWHGSLQELAAAPFPDATLVARHERDATALATERDRRREEGEQAHAALVRIDGELAGLTAAGTVPTPEAVQAARDARDRLWRSIRRHYVEGLDFDGRLDPDGDTAPPDADPAGRFEETVHRADALVDRREREAERISRFAALTRQRHEAVQAAETAATRLAAVATRDSAAAEAWAAAWSAAGLVPASPADMRGWLQRKDEVVRLADTARHAEQATARAADEARLARSHLLRAAAILRLEGAGGLDKAVLRTRVSACVSAAGERWGRLGRLRQELAARRRDLDTAERRLAAEAEAASAWDRSWATDMPLLGLAATASPAEAEAALAVWEDIQRRVIDDLQTRRRCDGIRHDIDTHRQAVGALMARVSPALDDLVIEAPFPAAAQRLRAAQALAGRRADIERQTATAATALETARTTESRAAAALAALRDGHAIAGAGDEGIDPIDLARRARERRTLARQLADARRELDSAGDGHGEAALRQEAADADPDSLAAAAEAVDDEAERLQLQGREAAKAVDLARQSLRAMELREGVGEAAWQARDAGRDMADIAQRWLRLRAAGFLLARSVDLYRDANQAPLVRRAGALLADIAGNGANPIAGLKVEYGDDDQPVLVGVRRDGSICPVDGMSEGTRDQLYLALRIATVERTVAETEPLPFVADDLFITSDEERTLPGIRALAELGRSTQVLLFTHHRYVVEAAIAALPAGALRLHSLAKGPPALSPPPRPRGKGLRGLPDIMSPGELPQETQER